MGSEPRRLATAAKNGAVASESTQVGRKKALQLTSGCGSFSGWLMRTSSLQLSTKRRTMS